MQSYADNLLIMRDSEGVAIEVAQRFACAAVKGVAEWGRFAAAVPGGSSPRGVFKLLAGPDYSTLIPWDRTEIFFTDERCVPPDHPDSNYRQANEMLLSRAPIPEGNIHRFLGEQSPESAAEAYGNDLLQVLGEVPALDLVILGMGADTHTASLFPDSPALAIDDRFAAANYIEKLGQFRLTLTYPTLNLAREVVIIATGSDKAEAVHQALRGEFDPVLHPVQGVKPTHGRLLWVIDTAAASAL